MSDVVMAPIEVVRMGAVQPMHPNCEVGVWRLDQQMEVIRHEAIRATCPGALEDDLFHHGEESPTVEIVEEDVSALSAAGRQVVDRSGRLEAWTSRHEPKLASSCPPASRGPQFVTPPRRILISSCPRGPGPGARPLDPARLDDVGAENVAG
jgi:hypothetical protein